MFMDKVKKFCDHSMILWEMAGDLLTNGQNPPPPGLLGLKKDIFIFKGEIAIFWTT